MGKRASKFLIVTIGLLLGNLANAQDLPKIIGDDKPTKAYLSPNTSISAQYDIYAVDSIDFPFILSKQNKPISLADFYGDAQSRQLLSDLVGQFKDSTATAQPRPFQLFIDTTQNLSITRYNGGDRYIVDGKVDYYKPRSKRIPENEKLKPINAYPVFIMNLNTDDSLLLSAQDGSVFMTCEAKNENGEWQAIEYWQSSWCGNSYHYYLVPPMQAAYTKMIFYAGKFKTLCRLSLSANRTTIYSNEIYLSVNPKQFLMEEITD